MAPHPPAADPAAPPPGREPPETVAPAADRRDLRADQEEERPGINSTLWDRLLLQVQQIEDLRRELADVRESLDGWRTTADEVEDELELLLDAAEAPARANRAVRVGWALHRLVRP